MRNNSNQKILIISSMVLLLATSVYFGQPKKAQALFGVGDFNVSDAVAIAKDAGFIALSAINHVFVTNFIQKAQQQYKVNDYLNYARNISDGVYVADVTANKNVKQKYEIKRIIEKLRGDSTADTDAELLALDNQQAAQNSAIQTAIANGVYTPSEVAQMNRENSADYLIKLNRAANVLGAIPVGRTIMATDAAQQTMGIADEAARLSLSSSSYKSSYQCVSKGTDQVQQDAAQVSCIVNNPSDYVVSQIDTKLQSIFDEQVKPNDGIRAILQVISTKYAQKLSDKIFNTQGSSLINDLQAGTGASIR